MRLKKFGGAPEAIPNGVNGKIPARIGPKTGAAGGKKGIAPGRGGIRAGLAGFAARPGSRPEPQGTRYRGGRHALHPGTGYQGCMAISRLSNSTPPLSFWSKIRISETVVPAGQYHRVPAVMGYQTQGPYPMRLARIFAVPVCM